MNYFLFSSQLFDSIASKHFNEPLQVIEKSKYALYVGAKSGNIYKLKLDVSISCQKSILEFAEKKT